MYESHFELLRPPFAETTDPSAYVPLASRESILRRLRYALERGGGAGLVFGPAGSGKTLLARRLIDDLGWPSAHLTFPAMPAPELLGFLADELASPPDPTPGTAGAVKRIRGALAAARANGSRILLVVDEIHLIDDPDVFEAIRMLLNFGTDGTPDLALLLVGGPEVVLRLPAALLDRLAARCVLGPLLEAEAAEYLRGRLAAAGSPNPGMHFDDRPVAMLHRAADGLPRRLNRLADLAMLVAYARDLPRPDAESAAAAIREAGLDTLAA